MVSHLFVINLTVSDLCVYGGCAVPGKPRKADGMEGNNKARNERGVAAIREILDPYLDPVDSEAKSRDIVQALIFHRGDDPIGEIRQTLEPRRGRPGIEFAGARAEIAIQCYREWLASRRATR